MAPRHEGSDGGTGATSGPSGAALLAAMADAALVLDSDGSIRQWNDPAAALFPDSEPATFDLLARPEHRERVREAVASAAAGDAATVSFDLAASTGTDATTFECTAVDENGRTVAVLAVRRSAGVPDSDTDRPTGTDTEPGGEGQGRTGGTGRMAEDRSRRATDSDPLRRVESLESVGDGAYAIDGDRRFVAATDRLAATLGTDREALLGRPLRAVLAGESAATAVGLHEALLAGDRSAATAEVTLTTAGGELPVELDVAAVEDGDERLAVGLVRDVSDRHRRERQLARHRDQLATLNRISEAVEGVVQGIVESATREGIEETVCDRLADSDLYRTVWVGRIGAGGLEPTASAGAPTVFPDSGGADDDSEGAGTGHPALVAFRTGEPCVRRAGRVDGDGDGASGRERVAEHGIRATMALPITHRETPYGVLCLHSPRADAFTDREQAALERLARVVGFAINAADTEQLLHSGATTELEFRVTGDDCFLGRLSAATGPVTLRWTMPEDGGLRHFLEVEGAAESVVAAAEAAGAEDVGVVSERDGGEDDPAITILEARPASSVADRLGDAGAVVQSGSAEGGVAEFTARLAGRTDTRTVVETFQDEFDAGLTAKRRIDEPVETARDLRQAATERLTDRQSDVLRTAYLMGYYEWPRDHTAEDVADRMDITSATLHYHLRAAQRNFLELFFDESPAGG